MLWHFSVFIFLFAPYSALAETSAPMPAEPLQRLQALATDLASGDTSPP